MFKDEVKNIGQNFGRTIFFHKFFLTCQPLFLKKKKKNDDKKFNLLQRFCLFICWSCKYFRFVVDNSLRMSFRARIVCCHSTCECWKVSPAWYASFVCDLRTILILYINFFSRKERKIEIGIISANIRLIPTCLGFSRYYCKIVYTRVKEFPKGIPWMFLTYFPSFATKKFAFFFNVLFKYWMET